jgi:pimeloyl-ACP methyl ester carboxylesterase
MAYARRWILALVALAACAAPSAAPAQYYAPRVDMAFEPYASTADSVALPDGRHLHLVCMGEGSPTVILTAGLGDWSGSAWAGVQPDIAKITRVCSWDRPGFGLSDGVAGKVSVATNAADLEAALAQGAIPGPYVMVGHSLGAYETLLYTDRNLSKVVGMVLVDPSYLAMAERSKRLRERFNLPEPGPLPRVAQWRQCAEDVRRGALKAGGPDPDRCLAFTASFPRGVRVALTAQSTADARYWETAAAFDTNAVEEGSKLVINPQRDYGNMPLVVLTSTARPADGPPNSALRAASDALWNGAHDELAAFSKRGTNIGVPGADHYIQRSRPQAVLDAIQTVIRQAREAPAK